MRLWLVIFLLNLSLMTGHYLATGNIVWGDGRYYYAYTRSWIIDKNIDFTNEAATHPFFFESIVTPAGKLLNKYSIGAPILWSPWFILAHLFTLSDGFGHSYRFLIALGSVFYASTGIYLSMLAAKKLVGEKAALLATIALWLTTNLIFYSGIDPVNSHASSIFVSGLLVYLLTFYPKINFIFIGGLTGLLTLVRPQDGIWLLGLLWLFPRKILKLLLGFVPVAALQLLTWYLMIGSFTSPYVLLGEKFNWFKPELLPVWFSQNNGLFYYAPVLLLSLWGLWRQRQTSWAKLGLGLFFIQSFVIASWHGWWGGASYGARMFLSLTPLWLLGLAYFIRDKKLSHWQLTTVIFLLTCLNFFQIFRLLSLN